MAFTDFPEYKLSDEQVAYCDELANNIAYRRSHNQSIAEDTDKLTGFLHSLVDCGTITYDDFCVLLPWFLYVSDDVLD